MFKSNVNDAMERLVAVEIGAATLNIPYSGQGAVEALGMFDSLSREIVSVFLSERGAAKTHSSRKTVNFAPFKKNCHTVIGEILMQGHENLFELRLRQYSRYSRRQFHHLNPFQRGLLAIFAHDLSRDNTRSNVQDDKPKELLSAKNRHIFGHQMWQAFRHYVPPEFFIGFVWETSGGVARPMGRHDGWIKYGYQEWVIRNRANDNSNIRGRYPATIDKAALKLRNKTFYSNS